MTTDPRENHLFIGHREAVKSLHGAASTGRLHHAWLIGGPAGIGKATLAYRFARWLLAGGTASISRSRKTFPRSGASPPTPMPIC